MKQFELFQEWVNNNVNLNTQGNVSIVRLINEINDDSRIRDMISNFSVHSVSRDVLRSSYGIEYEVRVDIEFKDGTSVRTKRTFLNSSHIENYFVEYDEEFKNEGHTFNDLPLEDQWYYIYEWIEIVIDCYWNI